MEETQHPAIKAGTKFVGGGNNNGNKGSRRRHECFSTLKELSNSASQQYQYQYQYHFTQCQNGHCCQNRCRHHPAHPALLPLLPLPPLIPFQLPHSAPLLGAYPPRSKPHYQSGFWDQRKKPAAATARTTEQSLLETNVAAVFPVPRVVDVIPPKIDDYFNPTKIRGGGGGAATAPVKQTATTATTKKSQALIIARRPDSGGQDGRPISLVANHFRVDFDPSQNIYHYDLDISPRPSRETARAIKRQLVRDNPGVLSDSLPAFDGRKNMYSPIEFRNNRIELYVSLPLPQASLPLDDPGGGARTQKAKLFRVIIRLVSKMSGEELNKYLLSDKDVKDEDEAAAPLPQDYLQALDVVLRESPTEHCTSMGRSLYSPASSASAADIGGGAVGLRGFFQSLRATQQGLALNVDLSVTAFHEGIAVIAYLQKRVESLRDLGGCKKRTLTAEERREAERVLRNVRVFVRHRATDQRYRVHGLTEEPTEQLRFRDRDGREMRVVEYYKDQYGYDVQYRGLPCLQMSRSKACYLPLELCVVCEGQKFLGRLSDDQTSRILRLGCQRPAERRGIINGVMGAGFGPSCDRYTSGFNLRVSKDMTQLRGRVLQPPKLRFGDGGSVRDVTPSRQDRQWSLSDSHVAEGARIKRWALVSFGGTVEQRSCVPKFAAQLAHRCDRLGVHLSRTPAVPPTFEPAHVLNSVPALESRLRRIHEAAGGDLQLLVCVMERKHKGYADLKRVAETSIGVVTQCCLYPNIARLGQQFLVNMALKINAKAGGCNVVLYNTLPRLVPRLFADDEPAMFMGADVTHPHPLDDSSPSVAAVVGSVNWPSANKYASRMRSQTHRQEIIQDLETMVRELLEEFRQGVRKLPARILFFRDGVSETQFQKVLKQELLAIRTACAGLSPGYKPAVTFAVVQKRHHTRLFPTATKDEIHADSRHSSGRVSSFPDENIPPGTVVDTVIAHPKEFDFYLCSHWGMKGTSRPTHYHVLWDDNGFSSDELQRLVHNLCYTFARCTKPVSLVPPAYYAHLAAYRGRLYLDKSDACSGASGRTTVTRSGPPLHTVPLPELQENVKKLMFYC